MTITISSIRMQEFIVPGRWLNICYPSRYFVYVESHFNTIFICNNVQYEIHPNDIAYGNDFKILNQGEEIGSVLIIVFQVSIDYSGIKNRLYITRFNKLLESTKRIIARINTLLSFFGQSQKTDLIKELENSVLLLLDFSLPCNNDTSPESIQSPRMIDSRLIKVHRYIRKHYNEPLTLHLLSDLIECNPVYLSNTYSKVFNVSPMKYVQCLRMKRALELLSNTELTVKKITQELGYISNSQFSELFKRYYGLTPLEYRRKGLNNVTVQEEYLKTSILGSTKS